MSKHASVFLVSALGIGLSLLLAQQAVDPANSVPEGRLSRYVLQARAAGVNEIKLPRVIGLPTGVKTVDRLVRDYSLLRVAVVDAATASDANDIRTWYKLRILEAINTQPRVGQEHLQLAVPPRLLPLGASDTLYMVFAGTVVVEGIRLIQPPEERGLILRRDRQYLGAFYLGGGGLLAGLAAGSASLYEIDGDELRPQSDGQNALVEDVRRVCGNRLSTLRVAVRR